MGVLLRGLLRFWRCLLPSFLAGCYWLLLSLALCPLKILITTGTHVGLYSGTQTFLRFNQLEQKHREEGSPIPKLLRTSSIPRDKVSPYQAQIASGLSLRRPGHFGQPRPASPQSPELTQARVGGSPTLPCSVFSWLLISYIPFLSFLRHVVSCGPA